MTAPSVGSLQPHQRNVTAKGCELKIKISFDKMQPCSGAQQNSCSRHQASIFSTQASFHPRKNMPHKYKDRKHSPKHKAYHTVNHKFLDDHPLSRSEKPARTNNDFEESNSNYGRARSNKRFGRPHREYLRKNKNPRSPSKLYQRTEVRQKKHTPLSEDDANFKLILQKYKGKNSFSDLNGSHRKVISSTKRGKVDQCFHPGNRSYTIDTSGSNGPSASEVSLPKAKIRKKNVKNYMRNGENGNADPCSGDPSSRKLLSKIRSVSTRELYRTKRCQYCAASFKTREDVKDHINSLRHAVITGEYFLRKPYLISTSSFKGHKICVICNTKVGKNIPVKDHEKGREHLRQLERWQFKARPKPVVRYYKDV